MGRRILMRVWAPVVLLLLAGAIRAEDGAVDAGEASDPGLRVRNALEFGLDRNAAHLPIPAEAILRRIESLREFILAAPTRMGVEDAVRELANHYQPEALPVGDRGRIIQAVNMVCDAPEVAERLRVLGLPGAFEIRQRMAGTVLEERGFHIVAADPERRNSETLRASRAQAPAFADPRVARAQILALLQAGCDRGLKEAQEVMRLIDVEDPQWLPAAQAFLVEYSDLVARGEAEPLTIDLQQELDSFNSASQMSEDLASTFDIVTFTPPTVEDFGAFYAALDHRLWHLFVEGENHHLSGTPVDDASVSALISHWFQEPISPDQIDPDSPDGGIGPNTWSQSSQAFQDLISAGASGLSGWDSIHTLFHVAAEHIHDHANSPTAGDSDALMSHEFVDEGLESMHHALHDPEATTPQGLHSWFHTSFCEYGNLGDSNLEELHGLFHHLLGHSPNQPGFDHPSDCVGVGTPEYPAVGSPEPSVPPPSYEHFGAFYTALDHRLWHLFAEGDEHALSGTPVDLDSANDVVAHWGHDPVSPDQIDGGSADGGIGSLTYSQDILSFRDLFVLDPYGSDPWQSTHALFHMAAQHIHDHANSPDSLDVVTGSLWDHVGLDEALLGMHSTLHAMAPTGPEGLHSWFHANFCGRGDLGDSQIAELHELFHGVLGHSPEEPGFAGLCDDSPPAFFPEFGAFYAALDHRFWHLFANGHDQCLSGTPVDPASANEVLSHWYSGSFSPDQIDEFSSDGGIGLFTYTSDAGRFLDLFNHPPADGASDWEAINTAFHIVAQHVHDHLNDPGHEEGCVESPAGSHEDLDATLLAMHVSLHEQEFGTPQDLHSWFHTNFCGSGDLDDSQVGELHDLFHTLIGHPPDEPGFEGDCQ